MTSHASTPLLKAAQAGDRKALETLLSSQASRIYGFGLKMCKQEQDAEDILQETMLAAARTISGFQGDSSLSTWLYTIARSFCIKKRRKSQYAPQRIESLEEHLNEGGQVPHSGKSPDAKLQDRETQKALELALTALPPEQRELILLRDLEGLSTSETAKVLELSISAVKGRLHRARAQLRENLAPLLHEVQPSPRPSCPDVLHAYSENLEGDLNPTLCRQLEEHLRSCPDCQATCDALKRTLALCGAHSELELPAHVQKSLRAQLLACSL